MTEITSNAYNFNEHISAGVDPRTGSFSMNINMGEFISHKGSGINIPLLIMYSESNPFDTGFGRGWSFPLSSFKSSSNTLSLSSGQSFKIEWDDEKGEYNIPYRKLKDIRVYYIANSNEIKIVYKGGKTEFISFDTGAINRVVTPQGLKIHFEHSYKNSLLLLWRIFDNEGREVEIDWWSDSYSTILTHTVEGSVFQQFSFSKKGFDRELQYFKIVNNNEYTSIEYYFFKECKYKCISKLIHSTGMIEELFYKNSLKLPIGAPFKYLPRIYTHIRYPGKNQERQTTTYKYSEKNHSGFGSDRKWLPGIDNLFYSRKNYKYSSVEIVNYTKKIIRTYNKYHLLERIEFYNNAILYKIEELIYYANTERMIEEQPPQYSLLKEKRNTLFFKEKSRVFTFKYEYDEYANILSETAVDGSSLSRIYYPIEGEAGKCPPEPNGMISLLSSETFTPAESQYSVKIDHFSYKQIARLDDSSNYFIVLHKKTADSGTTSSNSYNEDKNDKLLYGRLIQTILSINNFLLKTYFNYTFKSSTYTIETKVVTYDGLIATSTKKFDFAFHHVIKTINIEGQIVVFDYDQLGREIKNTIHPDLPEYLSSSTTKYSVEPNNNYIEKTDSSGNKETIVFNNAGNNIKTFVHVFGTPINHLIGENIYDHFGLLIHETTFDYDENHNLFVKISNEFEYDLSGEISKINHSDGRIETIVQNNVELITTHTQLGLMSVITKYNVSSEEIEKRTIDSTGVLLAKSNRQYDGYGRLIKIIDTDGNVTEQSYDIFDRLVTVKRFINKESITESYLYADFTTTDLPTSIFVDNKLMGSREIDGLLRISSETSSGITKTFEFKNSSPLITKIITARGNEISIEYDPHLMLATARKVHQDSSLNSKTKYNKSSAQIINTLNKSAKTLYYYDKLMRIIKEEEILNNNELRTSSFVFSLLGRNLSYTDYNNNKRNTLYDIHGRIYKTFDYIDGECISTLIKYDKFSRANNLTSIQENKTTTLELYFNAIGLETNRTFRVNRYDKSTNRIISITQTYHSSMQLKQRLYIDSKQTSSTIESYDYDTLHRLVKYVVTGENKPCDEHGNIIKEQLFKHDKYGNITQVISVFENDSSNTQDFIYNIDAPDRLGRINNTHSSYHSIVLFYYDADGNLVNDEMDRWYRFNAIGQLDSVLNRNHQYLSQYSYSTSGNMVSQKFDDSSIAYLYYIQNTLSNEICDGVVSNYINHEAGFTERFVKNGAEKEHQLLLGNSQQSTMLSISENKGLYIETQNNYTPHGYSKNK